MQKATAADRATKPLTETKAAQQMWIYYKENKPNLISRIRVHRESILSTLMQGTTPNAAFAPYFRPPSLQICRPSPHNVKPNAARNVMYLF